MIDYRHWMNIPMELLIEFIDEEMEILAVGQI